VESPQSRCRASQTKVVDVNVFNGLPVGLVPPIHATATGGLSHGDPVGAR
jgi:hypothetical protein